MKLGKPIKYVAVQPSEVLERVKKKVIIEANNKTKSLDTLQGSEILKELNLLHSQGVELVDPTDLSGALKGRSNLYNHIESMIKSAEHSVDMMTTSEGLIRKADTLKSLMQKAKDRNVRIRIAAPITKETEKSIKEFKNIAEVRNISEIKARFCIIDGKQITFMLLDDSEVHPTYDSGVWVNTPFFSSALKQMFETEWAKVGSLNIKN